MKNPEESWPSERIAWCAVFVVLVLAGIVRYRLVNIPLERDEGEYAYAGQLILQGVPPYQGFYNMKLPGIYGAYAVLLAVLGQTHQAIHMGLLIINAATTVMVFLLARQIVKPLGAVAAAAGFALLSVSESVQGVFANAEHFVIFFATAGLLVMLRALARRSLWRLFFAGVLLGLGFTMKQHGLAFVFLGALYVVYDLWRQDHVFWRGSVRGLACFAAGVVAVYGVLCLVLVWAGVFGTFWFWTVQYAWAYVSQVPLEDAWRHFHGIAKDILRSAPLMWMLVGCGLLALATRTVLKQHKVFLIMFAALTLLSLCPGLYFRRHYFALVPPCAALLVGVAIAALTDMLSRVPSRKLRYGVPVVLMVVCVCHGLYRQRDFLFHMTSFEIGRSCYWPNPFHESPVIAEYIRTHTTPEDRIAILGSEPQIFFYARRRSASPYIYMYPFFETHDAARRMQSEFIRDIEASDPKFVLYCFFPTTWSGGRRSDTTLTDWFERYRKRRLKFVGVVELLSNETLYHWEPNVKWPPRSQYWVAVLQRRE